MTLFNFNTTLVKVHQALYEEIRAQEEHFNTTLVKVHLQKRKLKRLQIAYFNTTLVKVHPVCKRYFEQVKSISIQPLLRFILESNLLYSLNNIISIQPLLRFICGRDSKGSRSKTISIQPLLRFISKAGFADMDTTIFQYNPC